MKENSYFLQVISIEGLFSVHFGFPFSNNS